MRVRRGLVERAVRALVVAAVAILMAAFTGPVSAFAQESDFEVWIDASPMQPAAGENVTYTIRVTNDGPDPADSAELDITMPAGTSFVSLSTPVGWSSTTPAVGGNGPITSDSGFMVPETVVFTLVLQVDAGTAPGTMLTTGAVVPPSPLEPNPGNNVGSITVTVPHVPTAGPVSATVAYGSSNNPITLAISGATATSVAVATAPGHGTASAAGATSIAYTPASGYSGPDSFTYTATNASGTSAPATVTITVNPPPVLISPTSLPPMFASVPFDETITASGGTPPYTYDVTAGALPPGLSLSAAGALSGTPTTGGGFAFTISATDSSGSPLTGSRAYSVNVGIPSAPIANPAGATMGMDAAPVVITPSLSGGPATSLVVGTAPAHGTVSITGMSFTYTPAAGYFGPDLFTYTATGPGGTSNVATVSITVTPPTAPTANDVTAMVAANSTGNPITLDISGGEPTGVAVAAAPAHGTANVTGTSITYTPAAGYSGPDSFTYTASNSGGMSAPATVTITVAAPALSLWSGPLPDAMVGAAYGQAITATGGTAPYSFALSSGTLPAGMSLAASGLLSGTPVTPGSYAFSVTATDVFGAVGLQAYVLVVTENADAVRARFSQLGQEFVETRMNLLASGIDTPGLSSRTGPSGRPGTVTANTSGSSQVLGFAASLAEVSAAGGAAEVLAQGNAAEALPFNVWVDARMTLHARSQEAGHWGEFALVSIGSDYLIEENLLAGVALHGDWMRDASVDSEIRGSGFLVGPYVSIGLDEGLTLDISAFYGRSWNDAAATVTGLAYSGRFETGRLLLKAKLEGTWQADTLSIRPNATFILSAEQAGAYTVSSATGGAALVPGFEKTDYRFGLGATFEYAYLLENGIELTPQFGIGLAGGNGGVAVGHLFSQGYGKLMVGADLAADAWTLGGKIEFDIDTSGRSSLSAKSRLGLAF